MREGGNYHRSYLTLWLAGWSVRGGGETGRSQMKYVKEFGFCHEGARESGRV